MHAKPRLFARRRVLGFLLLLGLSDAGAAQQTTPVPATPAPLSPAPLPEPPSGAMVTLEARPVLRLKGQTTWDGGFDAMKKGFAILEAEAARLALPRIEQPLAHFLDSDEIGFTYEVMLPVASTPQGLSFAPGVDIAQSPAGRAVVFPYEGAYDDIDAAYEAITAWMDDKSLIASGMFLETYLTIPEKSDDPALKLTISVFLK